MANVSEVINQASGNSGIILAFSEGGAVKNIHLKNPNTEAIFPVMVISEATAERSPDAFEPAPRRLRNACIVLCFAK